MFRNLLKKIARELDRSQIQYIVIGGQAVLLYGEPRLTKDIDITLGIGVDELEKATNIVRKLKLRFLVNKMEKFVRDTMVLPTIDDKSGIRVDFIFSFSPYEKRAIARANSVKFGKTVVKFASLEDVVIHKIIAGRARDIEDVKAILLKNPNYDAEYISRCLRRFDKSLGESFFISFKKIKEEITK